MRGDRAGAGTESMGQQRWATYIVCEVGDGLCWLLQQDMHSSRAVVSQALSKPITTGLR